MMNSKMFRSADDVGAARAAQVARAEERLSSSIVGDIQMVGPDYEEAELIFSRLTSVTLGEFQTKCVTKAEVQARELKQLQLEMRSKLKLKCATMLAQGGSIRDCFAEIEDFLDRTYSCVVTAEDPGELVGQYIARINREGPQRLRDLLSKMKDAKQGKDYRTAQKQYMDRFKHQNPLLDTRPFDAQLDPTVMKLNARIISMKEEKRRVTNEKHDNRRRADSEQLRSEQAEKALAEAREQIQVMREQMGKSSAQNELKVCEQNEALEKAVFRSKHHLRTVVELQNKLRNSTTATAQLLLSGEKKASSAREENVARTDTQAVAPAKAAPLAGSGSLGSLGAVVRSHVMLRRLRQVCLVPRLEEAVPHRN